MPIDLHQQAHDGAQIFIVITGSEPVQRLLASTTCRKLTLCDFQLARQHRQHRAEIVDHHLQALIERQTHALQQAQQIDQQRQFVDHAGAALAGAPPQHDLWEHEAHDGRDDHQHDEARAIQIVVRQGAGQRRQRQRAHEPRHQKEAARARVDETALFKQPAVFFGNDLSAQRCVEPANSGVRKALEQAFETLWLHVMPDNFRVALNTLSAACSHRDSRRCGLQRAFVERVPQRAFAAPHGGNARQHQRGKQQQRERGERQRQSDELMGLHRHVLSLARRYNI